MLKIVKFTKKKLPNIAITLVEVLVVFLILSLILYALYKIFFSQAKVVQHSVETILVNDSFRKVLAFLGNDIREANKIVFPNPIRVEEINNLVTKPGLVLQVIKQEINPFLKPSVKLGYVETIREIIYELEKIPLSKDSTAHKYRLIRTEYITDFSGEKQKQRHELIDNIKEFVLFRLSRKPCKIQNITSLNDKLVIPLSVYDGGTSTSLVHLRITLEKRKLNELDKVYSISAFTSFYKRGREIFIY